jgi:hypothetical protein
LRVLKPSLMAIVLTAATSAHGADMGYCVLYSREMMRSYIRQLPAENLTNLTVDSMQYILTKYLTHCLLVDDPPLIKDLPSDGQWVADIWSQIQHRLPAPTPETVPVKPPPPPAPPVAAAPIKSSRPREPKSRGAGAPQPLCSSHGMKTVYNGRSWRCATQ